MYVLRLDESSQQHRPWNYPMILSLQPLIAAIAAGCPCVVKPSEISPTYSQLLADLFPKYLDPSAYRVVNGGADPETTKLLNLQWAHSLLFSSLHEASDELIIGG